MEAMERMVVVLVEPGEEQGWMEDGEKWRSAA